VFVRADALEGVAVKVRELARKGPFRDEDLGLDTGTPPEDVPAVLLGLGCARVGGLWVGRRSRT
jgi:hypothetical protein